MVRIKVDGISWQQLRLYIVVFVWIILLATVASCAVWLIIKAGLFWRVIAVPQIEIENLRKDEEVKIK